MPTFKQRHGSIVSILLTMLLCLCTPAIPASTAGPTVPARATAPDFTLVDAGGVPFRLSAQRGKVVLVDFWATWCGGCKVEIPWFIEFQKKYQTQGLTSIGVAMDEEGWAKVRPYLAQHPISYPVVIGNLDLLQRQFGLAPSLPITLLIDRQGRIAASHAGVVDKNTWENKIVALLKER
ncbi:TlpA disulfide reductase family protein [Luteitalea sp.]